MQPLKRNSKCTVSLNKDQIYVRHFAGRISIYIYVPIYVRLKYLYYLIMQCLLINLFHFVLAMRSSVMFLLVALAALAYADETENLKADILLPIKNGFVQLNVINHIVVLNLIKYGKYNMCNTIHYFLVLLTR